MRGTLRRFLVAAFILAIVAGAAYQSRYKIHIADFTWSRFVDSVSRADGWLLLLSVVAIYGCYALRALRWQRFSRHIGVAKFGSTYSATLMGFTAIFVLGRAGEPVRPLLLARKDRLPVSSMFGIFFLERFVDFAAAVGLVCVSLLVFPRQLSAVGADMTWVGQAGHGARLLIAALLILVAALVYYRMHGAEALDRRLAGWRSAGAMRRRVAAVVSGFSEGLAAIRSIPDLIAAIVYSTAHWGLAALVYLWVTRAFAGEAVGSRMNFPGAMLLLAVTVIGSALQLPGIGGGAQIASFIGLTKIFGFSPEPAVAIAVVLWLITFASCTLAGIPLLIHEGLSVGELRKLARAEEQAEEAGTHLAVPEAGPSEVVSGDRRGDA